MAEGQWPEVGLPSAKAEGQANAGNDVAGKRATIIHWNTIYTGRIVNALRNAGEVVPEHLLSSLSPLSWEHVNLTGDYLWEDKPAVDEHGFRPISFAL